MQLDAEGQRALLYESTQIAEEGHGARRWSEAMTTIVQAEDGKLYRINWDRGLTEAQEDEFQDGEVPEVFPVDSLKVRSSFRYLTAEEQKVNWPTLAEQIVLEADSYAIVTGTALAEPITSKHVKLARELKAMLPALSSLDLASNSGAYRLATEQYLDALIALGESKV